MNIETLIYAYLAVCTSMIVFNCACIFVFRRRDVNIHRNSLGLEEKILAQIERMEKGEAVEEDHKRFLKKKLCRAGNLLAFDDTLEHLLTEKPEAVWRYLEEINTVFLYLAIENKYRSPVKLTYFAHVVGKYRILEGKPVNPFMDVMMRLLKEPSLYCRENALYAIYSCGDCGCVLKALKILDESTGFHHSKLLTDGLLAFAGDHERLADMLWGVFEGFSVRMQVVILDYIRFSGKNMCRELLELLADGSQDDEIRFSCIRYFGKYSYEPAYPLLISFAEDYEKIRWEYAAIAASALASYPREHSIEVLKECLTRPNWYVRFNAAKSLEHFHLTYAQLSDVFDGRDRYAREILQYRMDIQNIREKQEENGV